MARRSCWCEACGRRHWGDPCKPPHKSAKVKSDCGCRIVQRMSGPITIGFGIQYCSFHSGTPAKPKHECPSCDMTEPVPRKVGKVRALVSGLEKVECIRCDGTGKQQLEFKELDHCLYCSNFGYLYRRAAAGKGKK